MNDDTRLRETEAFLHEQIPITKAMGVRVDTYDEEKLVLAAPLEVNHNHLGTAFGGSLVSIATLAGYSALWLELGNRDAHIVVRKSEIDYRHPVRGEIRAVCKRPGAAAIASFRKKFERTGKARIKLHVTMEEDGQLCVGFEGVFVAIR
jgi:thioesterase domain-containing protein